jgi:hypothetical protein
MLFVGIYAILNNNIVIIIYSAILVVGDIYFWAKYKKKEDSK